MYVMKGIYESKYQTRAKKKTTPDVSSRGEMRTVLFYTSLQLKAHVVMEERPAVENRITESRPD